MVFVAPCKSSIPMASVPSPKTRGGADMSSRLFNMKFMQRGSESHPTTSSPLPAAKRRRTVEDSSIHQAVGTTTRISQHDSDGSKWYLRPQSTPCEIKASNSVNVVAAGWSALDASMFNGPSDASDSDDSGADTRREQQAQSKGRLNFGAFKSVSNQNVAETSINVGRDENNEEDEPDSNKGFAGRRQHVDRHSPATKQASSKERSRKRGVDLNKITSVSNAKRQSGGSRTRT